MKTEPVTPTLVSAMLRGKPGPLVARLCNALLSAWRELEASKEKPPESDHDQEAKAYDSREKVLVVVYPDGFVEVYAESWVDVRVVCLKAWELDSEFESGLPECYKDLLYPVKLRRTGNTAIRPKLDDEALIGIVRHSQAMDLNKRLDELLETAASKIMAKAAAIEKAREK